MLDSVLYRLRGVEMPNLRKKKKAKIRKHKLKKRR